MAHPQFSPTANTTVEFSDDQQTRETPVLAEPTVARLSDHDEIELDLEMPQMMFFDRSIRLSDTSNNLIITFQDTPVEGQIYTKFVAEGMLTSTLRISPSFGECQVKADGAFVYKPAFNFAGTDSFAIQLSDQGGYSETISIYIEIIPKQGFPSSKNMNATLIRNATYKSSIIPAQSCADPLVYTIASAPRFGTAVVYGDGTFSYSPVAGFCGSDSFKIFVTDESGQHDLFAIHLKVIERNQPPVADGMDITVAKSSRIQKQICAYDPDEDPLTYHLSSFPSNGLAALRSSGVFVYTPIPDFVGIDRFSVRIDDDKGGSTTALIQILVEADSSHIDHDVLMNELRSADREVAPVVSRYNIEVKRVNNSLLVYHCVMHTEEGLPVSGKISVKRKKGKRIFFKLHEQPKKGTVSLGTNGRYLYEPYAEFVGRDSFSVIIYDQKGNAAVSVISVHVTEAEEE